MSFHDIFSRLKSPHNAKNHGTEKIPLFYRIWLLIFPVLMGYSLGMFAASLTGYFLGKFSSDAGQVNMLVADTNSEANSQKKQRGLDKFLSANPFRISPMKTQEPIPEPSKPKADNMPKSPDITLDEITLRGTLPGIGAWLDIKNELKLVLVGRNVDAYKLISVNYGDIMLRRGKEKPVRKYISYGPGISAKKPEAPKTPAPAPKQAQSQPKQQGNIIAALPGTQEGQVPGELVTNLVQNPFDELKRIRMRPNEKAGGLEVQWIQNDSLLKRLGVQRGDVIRSVNGIPFTNMGDIANSINSLMTSERFDVEVTRGGKNTALRYVVK